jgi:FixJ family two-component response regulator
VRAWAQAGAICFLGKPFAGPVLINWIETALIQDKDGVDK